MFEYEDHQKKTFTSTLHTSMNLLSYPINMSLYLSQNPFVSIPSHALDGEIRDVTPIMRYALAHWNAYVESDEKKFLETFLVCAEWLVEHVVHINTSAGWPIEISCEGERENLALSALIQGQGISVLVRAYQVTQQKKFLDVAQIVVETFKLDILDGGVCAPIGEDGIFFEEMAVYPATHALHGFLSALLGLYEYVTITHDPAIEKQIERANRTMHEVLKEFDTGFWVSTDLFSQKLATLDQLVLYIRLFRAIVEYSDCHHCHVLISRWKKYQRNLTSRVLYRLADLRKSYITSALSQIRSKFFPRPIVTPLLRVCVPITAFPIAGGMRSVLTKVAQVTSEDWQMEYVTRHVGPDAEGLTIHRFSKMGTSPWQFPTVLLYCAAGFWKLSSLLRHNAHYHMILPQDGIFTAFFAASVAKLSGIRVVCIDHGNLTLLDRNLVKAERDGALSAKHSIRSRIEQRLLALYWPCLYPLAWLSVRLVDHFLIPGAPGDGVEEICTRLGVPRSRLTRFTNMIDVNRHIVPTPIVRANEREKHSIPADAIVISMVCRLAPEKGLDIALDAIRHALTLIPSELQQRVRVIFAGDGPLRKQLEEDIALHKLSQICMLRGELSENDVISLLGISDIFLFTSRRAAGYPLAIMEAMASGCATLATNEPLANIRLLSEGRGMVVPIGDVEKTAESLAMLLCDAALRREMGQLARDYISRYHSPAMFRRVLIRIGYWSRLDELLATKK